MMVILKGAALKRIDTSLLETGWHPKTALAMSLCTILMSIFVLKDGIRFVGLFQERNLNRQLVYKVSDPHHHGSLHSLLGNNG